MKTLNVSESKLRLAGELIRNSKGVCTPRGNSGSQRKLKCPETARNFSITAKKSGFKNIHTHVGGHVWTRLKTLFKTVS